jgi:hypothetical protein
MDWIEKYGDNDEPSDLDIFVSSLHGDTKVRFDILLDQQMRL